MSIFSVIQTYAILGAGIIVGVASSGAAFYLYNNLVDNPRIEAETKKLVESQVTIDALSKQLYWERHYKDLANQARDQAVSRLADLQERQDKREKDTDNEISKDTVVSRPSASQYDVDWLRNAYRPQTSSGGPGSAKGPTSPP